jgi:hypothetical protein
MPGSPTLRKGPLVNRRLRASTGQFCTVRGPAPIGWKLTLIANRDRCSSCRSGTNLARFRRLQGGAGRRYARDRPTPGLQRQVRAPLCADLRDGRPQRRQMRGRARSAQCRATDCPAGLATEARHRYWAYNARHSPLRLQGELGEAYAVCRCHRSDRCRFREGRHVGCLLLQVNFAGVIAPAHIRRTNPPDCLELLVLSDRAPAFAMADRIACRARFG